jgi:hypothetical protein
MGMSEVKKLWNKGLGLETILPVLNMHAYAFIVLLEAQLFSQILFIHCIEIKPLFS